MTFEEIRESLVENKIATANELDLVCTGFGATIENLNTVLYVRTGYRDMEQLLGFRDCLEKLVRETYSYLDN